jgi:APA family basic amino acid/polyamine antiporter
VPALSAVASVALMASLPGSTWTRLFAWMAVGMAIYFFYGYRRSRLGTDRGAEIPEALDLSSHSTVRLTGRPMKRE